MIGGDRDNSLGSPGFLECFGQLNRIVVYGKMPYTSSCQDYLKGEYLWRSRWNGWKRG